MPKMRKKKKNQKKLKTHMKVRKAKRQSRKTKTYEKVQYTEDRLKWEGKKIPKQLKLIRGDENGVI